MANVKALGMMSMAARMEVPNAESQKVIDAFDVVVCVMPKDVAAADVIPTSSSQGSVAVQDLNLDFINEHQRGYMYAVDLIDDFDGPVCEESLTAAMREGKYVDLPECMRPKVNVLFGYTMSMAIISTGPSKWRVVKLFHFTKRVVFRVIKDCLCQGTLLMVDYGVTANKMMGTRVFMYLFERLGGLQFRHWEWPVPRAYSMEKAPKKTVDSMQEGFQFIKKHGPKSAMGNAFTEWAETQILLEDSPLYNWHPGLVKESLSNYSKTNCLATKKEFYPLTLKDVKPWVVDLILKPILGRFETSTFLLVGLPGIGKSPIAKILGILLSQYQINKHSLDKKASYRCANSLYGVR
jgi:hypothetical protein